MDTISLEESMLKTNQSKSKESLWRKQDIPTTCHGNSFRRILVDGLLNYLS
jgi:hypothetical protein